jgi:long-subunit fatty acid transport protein
VLVTTCVLLAAPASAQESVFGLQFLGVSEETSDARARGLGVLGIGMQETRSAITQNPASLAQLDYMTLSAMIVAGGRTARSATQEEDRAVARFPHARAALPMFGKFVFSLGFNGFRNFKGKINLPQESVDSFTYQQSFVRDGTIFSFPIGLSASLTRRLHVGATFDFVQGTVDESWETRGDSLVALATRRRGEMTARTWTLGAQWQLFDWMMLGGVYSPPFTGNGSTRTTVEDVRIVTTTTPIRDTSVKGNVDFPESVRLGLSANPLQRWMLTGDFLWRNWNGGYTGRLYEAEAILDEWRYGIGVEWQRAGRVDLRGGFSQHRWAQVVGGNELKESTLHLGTGFDISDEKSRMDLALEYSWIGSIASNLFEERTFRVIVSISGQEKWERRRPDTQESP